MWKFQDFIANQILREINFGYFEAPETAILTILEALNSEYVYGNFWHFQMWSFTKNDNSKPPKRLEWQF